MPMQKIKDLENVFFLKGHDSIGSFYK